MIKIKYILNEKFILAEKYILKEKVDPENPTAKELNAQITLVQNNEKTLREAKTLLIDKCVSPLKNFITKWKTYAENTKRTVDGLIKDTDEIKEDEENKNSISNKVSPEQDKARQAAFRAARNVFDELKDYDDEILAKYYNFNKIMTSTNEKNLNSFKLTIDDVLNFLNTITTDNEKIKTSVEEMIKKLEDLTEDIDEKDFNKGSETRNPSIDALLLSAKAVAKTTSSVMARLTDAEEDLKALEKLVSPITFWANKTSLVAQRLRVMSGNLAKEISEGISTNFKDTKDAQTIVEDLVKLLKLDGQVSTDWMQEFRDSINADLAKGIDVTDKFSKKWQEYLDTEWTESGARELINAIIETLNIEFDAFGYDSRKNPFLKFIKFKLENDDNFKTSVVNDHKKYDAIHDSAANNFIDEQDLAGNGQLKTDNILFAPDLFNHDYRTIQEYLKAQKVALKLSDEQTDKLEGKYKDYKNNDAKFIQDLFFEPGNIILNKTGDPKNKLKTTNTVYDELIAVFGEDAVNTSIQKAESSKTKDEAIPYTRAHEGKIIGEIKKRCPEPSLDENGAMSIIDKKAVTNLYTILYSKLWTEDRKPEQITAYSDPNLYLFSRKPTETEETEAWKVQNQYDWLDGWSFKSSPGTDLESLFSELNKIYRFTDVIKNTKN